MGGGAQIGGQAQGAEGGQSLKDRVLKMSTLVDQADESELQPATREQVDQWMGAYVLIMGSPPPEEEEPSEGHLAALHKKTVVLRGVPYTDFAIWTPFGQGILPTGGRIVYDERAPWPPESTAVDDFVEGLQGGLSYAELGEPGIPPDLREGHRTSSTSMAKVLGPYLSSGGQGQGGKVGQDLMKVDD